MKKQILSEEFQRMQKLAGLVNESQAKKMIQVLNESDDYDYYDSGQGSGSQSQKLKGTPINKSALKPGMRVKIKWESDGGQGSGSQGSEVINGIVKNVDMDYVYIEQPIDVLNKKYIKSYATKYAKTGVPILISAITDITTVE